MTKVERSAIVDYQTYDEGREAFRREVMAAKEQRRIHLGEALTFLFENALTIRYQVQEMMRVERLVKERDIAHELDTYNAVLGGPGELGCTLLIELDDPAERAMKLTQWLELPAHLYAELADGSKVRPTYDSAQIGTDRLSSVQYLKFAVGAQAPVALGSDLPVLTVVTRLTDAQRAALQADLDS